MLHKETRSTCPYCGVGCGVIIESAGAQITGVRGDPAHPANFGRLCGKGASLHLSAAQSVTQTTRLLHPMRREHRGAPGKRITWNEALDFAATGFGQIIGEYGPDAVGFYVSGQLLTEDYYVFNKLVKGLIGSNNIDTNSRLCMSSAVAGYKQSLGADAPPTCYEDIDHADCLFIAGSNLAWAHPVLMRRIEDARRARPQQKIICIDPRRTDTADAADLHLALQPGSDVMLFNGLLHIMLWEGWIDTSYIAAHTTGFEQLKASLRDCTPDAVAQVCGLKKDDLLTAARWFAGFEPVGKAGRGSTLSLYCQGLNQSSSGTAKNTALINLHLATGQIGRPGAGPFSLTGQPNAMGGREVGGLANLLSGHRDMGNASHRAEVAALWGLAAVPDKPGKTAVEMFQAAADGEIKALWIACTNPAQSMPDQATVRRALERAELVVLQEAFANTATCAFADLLLPATSWGEKDGTVTNSERRISRVRAAVAAPGEARHDWVIAMDFALRLQSCLATSRPQVIASNGRGDGTSAGSIDQAGNELVRAVATGLLNYGTPESIWNEHRESTRGRDLDITGMSYAMLEQLGPLQWPLPSGQTQGKARLYEDGAFPTPDGRARFVTTPWRSLAEPREPRYPFSLLTGRLRDQWHGMSRTGTLGHLFGHAPEPCVQMHPQDMARRMLSSGDLAHVTGKRGSITLPVQADEGLGLSQAYIAMHWGSESLGGRSSIGLALAGVNALTSPAYCSSSKQPELKHAAVKILKAELPWSMLGMAWFEALDAALAARESLRPMMDMFSFASCVLFSSHPHAAAAGGTKQNPLIARTGVMFRAASQEAPPDELMQRIDTHLGLTDADTLRYADKRRGQRRAMRLQRSGASLRLQGFVLAGDTSAQAWIRSLLQDELPADAYGRLLLAPGAKAPSSIPTASRQVCSCLGITEISIRHYLQRSEGETQQRLEGLQEALRCGTRCGSCLPELRRLVRATPVQAGA